MLPDVLGTKIGRLIATEFTDPARLARRLRKHRAHLLVFLDREGVDATNNLAEREIRPAVVARKMSAGNRTDAGAETHAVLASVLRTCRRQGKDILLSLGFEPAEGGVWEIAAPDAPALNQALDGARAAGALLVELERASRDLEDVLTEALAAGTA